MSKTMSEGEANQKLREAITDPLNYLSRVVELEKHLLTQVELPEPQTTKKKGGKKADETPEKVIVPLQFLTPEECTHFAEALRAFRKVVDTAGFRARTTTGAVNGILDRCDARIADLTGLANGTLRPLSGAEREAAEEAAKEAQAKLAEVQAQLAALNASLEL